MNMWASFVKEYNNEEVKVIRGGGYLQYIHKDGYVYITDYYQGESRPQSLAAALYELCAKLEVKGFRFI